MNDILNGAGGSDGPGTDGPNGDAPWFPPPAYVPKLGETDKVNAENLTMEDLAKMED
jgi:hypothetical protein